MATFHVSWSQVVHFQIHEITRKLSYTTIRWVPHPAFICSMLTIETLEQDVKYLQS